MAADRLSDLPDDLRRRVLHFAPAKEAASTAALSRRWRSSLWRSSGAVNLETRVEDYDPCSPEADALCSSRRDAFVSVAGAALDAADAPVTRLALRLEIGCSSRYFIHKFLYRDVQDGDGSEDAVVAAVISHPAARRVEELQIAAEPKCSRDRGGADDEMTPGWWLAMYHLHPESLPSENLRVLELTNCRVLSPAADGIFFPRLSSLRLRHCAVHLDDLQIFIDAPPALATVHLDSVLVDVVPMPKENAILLRCPAATVLVLERCRWKNEKESYNAVTIVAALEIDAPRLRCFRYKGHLRPLWLSARPPELTRADLHFFRDRYLKSNPCYHLATFWRVLDSFTGAKEMKLRVHHLEDAALLSEAWRAEVLPTFGNLDRLELQGMHRTKGKTAAVAIANLLRCCPVLRDLRINLTAAHHPNVGHRYDAHDLISRRFQSDRDRSMDLLNRCGSSEPTIDDDEVSDIPGLSRRSFECLRSSLRRVGLQFRMEESNNNCFGAKLARFFAENAMVLEEMHIDSGNGKLCEHMNGKVERWIASSSKRRNSGATSFVVLPLKR
ncbi:hypothetical protein BRADI_2g59980v3 [Brachypodium distachyon]|uniref:F-box domain-containing protein n=1 Tax=Brachypodium distachyon TaxID=15368 RepID=I1HUY7_BRADI|nr:hypothetical protein BRADI_2g59980v3 [Brachypodium distachyon]